MTPSAGVPTETATAEVVAASPTAPVGTATPDPVLLRDGGVAIIQTAFVRLIDEYIDPLHRSRSCVAGVVGRAAGGGGEGLRFERRLSSTGDRAADFAAFRSAYVPLASSVQDAKQLRFAAIRTMAASLSDCHTFFLTPTSSDSLLGARNGNGSVGIGVELLDVPPAVTEVISRRAGRPRWDSPRRSRHRGRWHGHDSDGDGARIRPDQRRGGHVRHAHAATAWRIRANRGRR